MKRGLLFSIGMLAGAIGAASQTAIAGVTPMTYDFTYQGRLDIAGVPFTGTAQMEFRIFDSLVGGAVAPAPAPPVITVPAIAVVNGTFTVTLNFGATAFVGDQRFLEIRVDTTAPLGDAYTTLTPRRLLTSTPYAAFALGVNGATITGLNASNIATGTIANARTTGNTGNVANTLVQRNGTGGFNAGAIVATSFAGDGSLLTNLNVGSFAGILPIANGGTGAGTAAGALSNLTGAVLASTGGNLLVGGSPTGNWKMNIDAASTAGLGLKIARGGGSRLLMRNNGSPVDSGAWGMDTTGGVADMKFYSLADNELTIQNTALTLLRNGNVLAGNDSITLGNETLTVGDDAPGRISLTGTTGTITGNGSDGLLNWRLYNGSWGELNLWDNAVANNLAVTARGDNSSLSLFNPNNNARMELMGNIGGETRMSLFNDLGNNTVFIDTDGNNFGRVLLNNATGATRVNAGVESDGGGQFLLYNAAGVATIQIDANFGGPDGRIITDELQITGGSDLSEQFDIASDNVELTPEPGMVVCINPDAPGDLLVSAKSYDRCVAGIISGANGIKPGMLMGQKNTEANGRHPVALTGRVYVHVTEANGSIEPGDLLTSSDEPGKAMKVTDFAKAQGAIIGKAMTRVDDNGMVLVLVGLQ